MTEEYIGWIKSFKHFKLTFIKNRTILRKKFCSVKDRLIPKKKPIRHIANPDQLLNLNLLQSWNSNAAMFTSKSYSNQLYLALVAVFEKELN